MIMSAFSYISHYLAVIPHIDEKIWQAQDEVIRLGPAATLSPQGEFVSENRRYNWVLSAQIENAVIGLYRIGLITQWEEGRKDYRIVRSVYAIHEPAYEEK